MKKIKLFVVAISFLLQLPIFAQVQVDKQIQLTGSGTDAEITGVKTVVNNQDATSVDAIQKGGLIYSADAGSANAYIVTLAPAPGGYTAGMMVNFKAASANTGASTINVNGLGARTIKKQVSNDLTGNDILAGQLVSVMYDGANFQMLSQLGNASAAFHGSQVFSCTGGNQFFEVPSGVTSINVKLWGAGGGGSNNSWGNSYGNSAGGGGAFLSGTLSVTPGQLYTIVVGQGGNYSLVDGSPTSAFGGGAPGAGYGNGGGGGRSAIIAGGTEILTAGAGGAGGGAYSSPYYYWSNGGGGGATTGGNGLPDSLGTCNDFGQGGTTTAGGAGGASCGGCPNGFVFNSGQDGSQFTGGRAVNYLPSTGAGGGGYYGGGGASGGYTVCYGNDYFTGGGGGGSSYYPNTGFTLISNLPGQTLPDGSSFAIPAAGGNTEPDYIAGTGTGGAGPSTNFGGNGMVILSW